MVIAEVQQENASSTDEETLVDIISAQAFVAAGQNNQGGLHESLRQGFASANHMLLEQKETRRNYVSIPALTPLVHIGVESDPDFTIPFVEGLPASRVKAEVLLDAAHALGTRASPRSGAPPQQTAENPNQKLGIASNLPAALFCGTLRLSCISVNVKPSAALATQPACRHIFL